MTDVNVCTAHPANMASASCLKCGRSICNVCSFDTAAGVFCPDCMTTASKRGLSGTANGVIAAICCTIGALLLLAIVVAPWVDGSGMDVTAATALGILTPGAILTGLTFGLIGRDSRRGDTLLPTLGVVASVLLLLIYVVLVVAGMTTS